jgi:hypothetical protein
MANHERGWIYSTAAVGSLENPLGSGESGKEKEYDEHGPGAT